MKLEEANNILERNDARLELGLPPVGEYLWLMGSDEAVLDGNFTLDQLKKLISFMESIEE